MRRSDKRRVGLFWQRIVDAALSVVVGGFVLSVLSVATGFAPVITATVSNQMANVSLPTVTSDPEGAARWYQPIAQEITATWQLTTDTLGRIFSSQVFQLAQVGSEASGVSDTLPASQRSTTVGVLQPANDPAQGTLRIGVPLVLDDTLQVTGVSTLGTTTVVGVLVGNTAEFTTVGVDGSVVAGSVSAGSVDAASVAGDIVSGGSIAGDVLTVSGLSTLETVEAGDTQLASLAVAGTATLSDLVVNNTFTLSGLLTASGGIATQGATIDAGAGEIFASNIVNQIVAGDNITITGTQNVPIIGVDTNDLVGVLSINDETGDVTLTGGIDITVNGTQIRNTSNLASVRARGGCTDCITDTDVRSDLTLSGGTINATPIGSTTPSTGRFTAVEVGTTTATTALAVGGCATVGDVLTVEGAATSTFQGSINIVDGCFAIGGVCVEGIAPSSYVGLTDTPSALLADAIQLANASGTALTQSTELRFTDGRLGIGLGTSTPTSTLSVGGDAAVAESLSVGEALQVISDASIGGALTVSGIATSTFAGSVNVTSGCVAVNGECLISGVDELVALSDVTFTDLSSGDFLRFTGTQWENASTSALGLGDGTYLGLTDTPATFTNNALQFANASGTALTQSADLVFTEDGRLGVGTSTPNTTIAIDGDGLITGAWSVEGEANVGGSLTVEGAATSTFQGSINIVDGCFAIDGECIVTGVDQLANLSDVALDGLAADDLLLYNGSVWENVPAASLGLGDGTFAGLTDTPSGYTAGAIPFALNTEDGLTQSSNFIFDGTRLGVGTDDLRSTLTVGGGLSLLENGILRLYNTDNTEYVGFRAPSGISSTTVWTLPEADGSLNQLLVTDGAGNLRFDDVSSIGGGATTYLELLDTPNVYIAGAIPFATSTEDGLTQSENLTFADNELFLDGSARFLNAAGNTGLFYNRASGRLGVGTDDAGERLTVRGSIAQFGGTAGSDNRYQPSSVAGLAPGVQFNDIDVVGDYIYVAADGSNNFRIIDISDPLDPVNISQPLAVGGNARAVTVQGQYAYVAASAIGNEFYIIDISDRTQPQIVAAMDIDDDLNVSVNDVVVQGRYAYVVVDEVAGLDRFFVIDVSDPTQPEIVHSLPFTGQGSARALTVEGTLAYVVTSSEGNNLHVVDISDPLSASPVGGVGLGTGANDVAVRGRYAYIAGNSGDAAFIVVDVSDPGDPQEVITRSDEFSTSANGVFVAGRYVYVVASSAGNDLYIYDIQDPTDPQWIGSRNFSTGNVNAVQVVGRYAYLAAQATSQSLHVVDISGAELQSAIVHSLQSGTMAVAGDLTVAGRVRAGLGLRAGVEGVQTDGSISALGMGSSFIAGSLGIGTSTPSSELTVAGTISSSDLSGTSTASLASDAQGNIIRDPSDERLKRNITDIDGALEMVLELRGVRYEWEDTERFGSAPSIGFIAQEVDEVVPEAVQRHAEYWSLNPARLVAVVVEAVKEMWSELRGTQRAVETLEQRVQDLELRLEAVQSKPSSSVNTNGGSGDSGSGNDSHAPDTSESTKESATSSVTDSQDPLGEDADLLESATSSVAAGVGSEAVTDADSETADTRDGEPEEESEVAGELGSDEDALPDESAPEEDDTTPATVEE